MAPQIIRGNNWREHFINLGNDVAKCIRCGKICGQMSSKKAWKVHLIHKHEVPAEENMGQHLRREIPLNLAWKYNTTVGNYHAKCILCDKTYMCRSTKQAETHLIMNHLKEIKSIKNDVAQSWLSNHFDFCKHGCCTRCTYCNFYFSIFLGIQVLTDHLISHNIRHIHLNKNKNIVSASSHQSGTQLQTAENREEQQRESHQTCEPRRTYEDVASSSFQEVNTHFQTEGSQEIQQCGRLQTYEPPRTHEDVVSLSFQEVNTHFQTEGNQETQQCESHPTNEVPKTFGNTIESLNFHDVVTLFQIEGNQEMQQPGFHQTNEPPSTCKDIRSASLYPIAYFQTKRNKKMQHGSHQIYGLSRTCESITSTSSHQDGTQLQTAENREEQRSSNSSRAMESIEKFQMDFNN